MKHEILEIFAKDGYRIWSDSPKGCNVFYKYQREGFCLVLTIEDERLLQEEQIRYIQQNVMELFYHPQGRLRDFPEGFPVYQVELLTVLLTDKEETGRRICSVGSNIWVYDEKRQRLLVYENQPGEFYGLRAKLEQLAGIGKRQKAAQVIRQGQFPYMTIAIVGINVIVYLIMSARGATDNALFMASNGAMYPDFLTYNHQWWRIITAMFLHFGITHLMNNMIIFYCIGSRLEHVIGHWKMLAVYMTAGIGGGLLSYAVMMITGDYAVSAGASGAVFGVIGGLLWVVIRHRGNIEGMTTRGMGVMLLLSLYFGFTTTGVDNWCHIGGLVCGFIAAMILYHRRQQID